MKLSRLNTPDLNIDSPIDQLFSSKKSKTLEALKQFGITTIYDVLWIFPIHTEKIPPISSFESIKEDRYFRGIGDVRDLQKRPGKPGKSGILLQNITVTIKDFYSDRFLSLRWFNAYPSIVKLIEKSEHLSFVGKIQDYNGTAQIVNPEISSLTNKDLSSLEPSDHFDLKIQYPTINKIKSFNLKKVIDKIPTRVWESLKEIHSPEFLKKNNFININRSFPLLHGVIKDFDSTDIDQAKRRLIFEEFFTEQSRLLVRRNKFKSNDAIIINKSEKEISTYFPFPFTQDQNTAFKDIISDMESGSPMMRLIQGDVGSGKTWVAFAMLITAIEQGHQAALMCPTESLARQHFLEAESLFIKHGHAIKLLLGSTKTKYRREIYEDCAKGKVDLLIGTHSLIQDDLIFKSLGACVIDEQHKFGVQQRIKLTSKGAGSHCLIMSATPIPRSLSLTQYGDLDITVIKSAPKSRSGFKTRIVTEQNFEKFLSFLKTRLDLKEQAYIVVPAIEDNDLLEMNNLENIFARFKKFFPNQLITPLHGKMTPAEKEEAFIKFKDGKINILIATSVVEVGINIPNATIMAILNPERFGLSSLHQLRGRVGRADKMGFCFLIVDKHISYEAQERLNFLEKNSDGFLIAEEDLIQRGQGDILGKTQSGNDSFKKIAHPLIHKDLLDIARSTVQVLSNDKCPKFIHYLNKFSDDELIHNTI